MAIAREIKYSNLSELLLDPKNPRLHRRDLKDLRSQDGVLEEIRGWDMALLSV
jgi:hypothetical protein